VFVATRCPRAGRISRRLHGEDRAPLPAARGRQAAVAISAAVHCRRPLTSARRNSGAREPALDRPVVAALRLTYWLSIRRCREGRAPAALVVGAQRGRSDMAEVEILGFPQSTYTRVARIVCEEKAIPYDLKAAPPHSADVTAI